MLLPLSVFLSGCLSNGSAGSDRGRGRAAGLRHHQEASDLVGLHGGHRVHTLLVSLADACGSPCQFSFDVIPGRILLVMEK